MNMRFFKNEDYDDDEDDDDDDSEYSKPLSLLYSGPEKAESKDQVYLPHVFQQSVTLTATMWNENDSKAAWKNWKIGNWGVLGEYSPLLMGLGCGFGIVLIVVTSLVLWRYCILLASKKVCCRGNYGVMASGQMAKNSAPTRLGKRESLSGFESFHRVDLRNPTQRNFTLQRSMTVDSIPLSATSVPMIDLENRLSKFGGQQGGQLLRSSSLYMEPSQVEPLMSRDVYTSHLYLQKLVSNSDMSKNLSRSTPTLEDLYAKVNFSKKRKNRMRKGDAAVIAMSKSHSGNSANPMDEMCPAVVVYNERTAL